MTKNGNGEGSIYPHKKNGKQVGYRGAYWVHTAEGPKRRYVSGKTREELRDKLIEALGNRAHGLVFDAGSIMTEDYLTSWLKDSVRATIAMTLDTYSHYLPSMGEQTVRAMDAALS
jgi:hypothetical protein